MYTPAVTMVAAWINADTGVGPSMASGSQTKRGICADLPVAPTSKSRPIAVKTPVDVEGPIVAAVPTKDRFPDQTGKRLLDVLQGIADNVHRDLQAVKISDLVASSEAGEPRLKSEKSRKGQ